MKDFSGENLRGWNFKGQNLTGADFSGADIRGAKFTNANLKGANFTDAKAGLQRRWMIFQSVIAFLLSASLNFFSILFTFGLLSIFFSSEGIERYTISPGLAVVFLIGAIYFVIACQGLTAKAFRTTLICVASAISGAIVITRAGSATVAVAVAVAIVVTIVVAGIVTGTVAATGSVTGTVAVVGAVAGAGAVPGTGTNTIVVAGAALTVLLSVYVAWRVAKEDEKFALARSFCISLGALGGTNFQGADLTGATFCGALLKNTKFASSRKQRTNLTHVCWKDAQKLNCTQVGDSILEDRKVRELLVTGEGTNQNFEDANLVNANLKDCHLNGANLKHANLNHAILTCADLQYANFTKAQAIGTDFTGAYLTGACLQAWNIDHSTRLQNVNCQFIFLREEPNSKGHRDRRPHDPDREFAPGEFEKLYQEAMNIIEVLLKDGMRNGEAFHQALAEVMQRHPEIVPDSIQKIERKGDDALVTFQIAEDIEVDKGQIERDLQQAYAEVRQLRGKVDELQALRAADAKEIAIAALTHHPQNIFNQIAGDQTMSEQKNQAISTGSGSFVNTGAVNLSGSTVNLGTISGTVTNTIHQLRDSTTAEAPQLADLLTQLKEAIDHSALSDDDKKDALEQVSAIAIVAQSQNLEEKAGVIRKAKKMLDVTLQALPSTATLVEACTKLLPAITKLLGIPL